MSRTLAFILTLMIPFLTFAHQAEISITILIEKQGKWLLQINSFDSLLTGLTENVKSARVKNKMAFRLSLTIKCVRWGVFIIEVNGRVFDKLWTFTQFVKVRYSICPRHYSVHVACHEYRSIPIHAGLLSLTHQIYGQEFLCKLAIASGANRP